MGPHRLPRLVFLHGWLGAAQDWRETAAPLSNSYRCLALDLPGHGELGNQAEGTRSLDEAVDWLNLRLHELSGEGGLILVGYSLGGRLAVELALREGSPVKGLVLMSSRPGIPEAGRDSRKRSDQIWSTQIRADWEGFLGKWYAQPMFNPQKKTPEEYQALIQKRSANHPGHAADTLLHWSPALQQDRMPWLIDCPVPLLYIAGSLDKTYAEIAGTLRGKSSDRRVEILEETGHAVHLDNPQVCAAAIEQFLEKNRETLWP